MRFPARGYLHPFFRGDGGTRSAAAFCGKKFLRTAVFEGKCWGGILTRCCPDKRIDNYSPYWKE
jgi:hypothetical protein